MLPHFVAEDFGDVIGELSEAGFPFEAGWFAPHFEFRFPRVGEIAQRGVELELRHALEPWHVLGEEASRRRDGALRRLVGRAAAGQGQRPGRRAPRRRRATAARVPLHPTGTRGEYVAGVRYRAWQPPSRAAPDDPGARAAGLRRRRHVDRPIARRLHLPRLPSRRPQPRHASRSTPTRPRAAGWRASSAIGHTPGPIEPARATPRQPRSPVHAGPAPIVMTRSTSRERAVRAWT